MAFSFLAGNLDLESIACLLTDYLIRFHDVEMLRVIGPIPLLQDGQALSSDIQGGRLGRGNSNSLPSFFII